MGEIVDKIRAGRISATVWRNTKTVDNRTFDVYSIQITKRYMDKDKNWCNTDNYDKDELPLIVLVSNEAYRKINLADASESKEQSAPENKTEKVSLFSKQNKPTELDIELKKITDEMLKPEYLDQIAPIANNFEKWKEVVTEYLPEHLTKLLTKEIAWKAYEGWSIRFNK